MKLLFAQRMSPEMALWEAPGLFRLHRLRHIDLDFKSRQRSKKN